MLSIPVGGAATLEWSLEAVAVAWPTRIYVLAVQCVAYPSEEVPPREVSLKKKER